MHTRSHVRSHSQVRAGENKQVEELQRQLDETEREKKRLLDSLSEKDERLKGRQQLLGDYQVGISLSHRS